MNRTSGADAGSNRSARIEKNIPYGLVPSALNTWTTFLPESGFASRKRYWPAGSVMPGIETGVLNVNTVRLSKGCAVLGPAVATTSRTTEQAERTVRLSMFGSPVYVSKSAQANRLDAFRLADR
jgi:hypothetical protein